MVPVDGLVFAPVKMRELGGVVVTVSRVKSAATFGGSPLTVPVRNGSLSSWKLPSAVLVGESTNRQSVLKAHSR